MSSQLLHAAGVLGLKQKDGASVFLKSWVFTVFLYLTFSHNCSLQNADLDPFAVDVSN